MTHPDLPPRFRAPSALAWVLMVGFAAFFIQGLYGADVSLDRLIRGASNLVRLSRWRSRPISPAGRPSAGRCWRR